MLRQFDKLSAGSLSTGSKLRVTAIR